MSLGNPRLWIAFLSTFAVVYLALGDLARRDPGPLAEVHQRIPELTGRANCSKCHGGWWVSMTEACLDCHKPIADQLAGGDGLHGALGEARSDLCVLCHSDHHGPDFAMVNDQSFILAGVPKQENFDHQMVGFEMNGQHLELACSECHQNADEPVLPEGESRFLGLDQDCASCHEDPHEDRYQLSCVQCHGQQAFDQLEATGHEKHLELLGAHGELDCRECHAVDDSHSLERLGERREVVFRQCLDCHDSPHDWGFMDAVADLQGSSSDAVCGDCHQADHASFTEESLSLSPEQHAKTGFLLDAPHDQADCAECHSPDMGDFAGRYPGREPDQCRVCHEDPHGGQFDEGPTAAEGCIACHERSHFEPHAYPAEMHGNAGIDLYGSHLEADCHDCHHLPSTDGPRVFHGTPDRCENCHKDAHFGYFEEFTALNEVPTGTCSPCHVATTFSDVPSDVFDHGEWTGFPVSGAHQQDGCETCHPRSPEPDQFGRRLGIVREHFGEYEGCHTCHADPHEGEFDKPDQPTAIDGQEGCARCHVQASFRSFPDGFDHGFWTGFVLEGVHAETGCSSCHEPLQEPTSFGRTWDHAASRRCADCHEDPHGGQFAHEEQNNCERCHRSAASFTALSFNHSIHSRFLLGDAHEDLACSECHKPYPHGDTEITRYRPLGTACVDCHGSQNGPLRPKRNK
ncbi:MAG: hypothetical protein ACYTG5_06390 [Planctomycetota bacterium]|jgi:hypothetical protein